MDSITPFTEDPKDIIKIDGDEITANLFKNVSLPPKIDKLETYLRIRPIKEPPSKLYVVIDNFISVKKEKKEEQRYEFSKILNEDASQETVYKNCAQPLVSKFVEGNDALLFAYGTTSSGKSYTIRGDDSNPGVIQRVLRKLFTVMNASQEPLYKRKNFRDFEMLNSDEKLLEINTKQRYLNLSQKLSNIQKSIGYFKAIEVERESSVDETTTFVFWVSFLEYYNEKPIDLLALDGDFQKTLKIYDNGAVQGLKHVFVSTAEEAFRIFIYGQARLNDHIKSNGLNLQSSRSHSMFTITAIAVNTRNQRALRVNNLAVCDLAGNERSSKTQSKGERLKEAGKINTSLLSLQNVIKGLRTSQKNKKDNSFVSYRDSKLTRSFKPYLDGTGFASMIINMNPSAKLTDETIGSLDFSATAAEVVVSTEDSRRQFQDSWKRLSQQWISSKQRWSSFAQSRKSLKFNIGDTLLEEIEEEELSVDEISGEFQRLSTVYDNCEKVDPSELEFYKSRIEILNAKIEMMNLMIEESETEQFQREMELRNELADKNRELNENLIQQHAAEKEKLRKENDEFMEKRLQIIRQQLESERNDHKRSKESFEKQLFELREKNIELECKLSAYESKDYKEKSTSTNIITLDATVQTDTPIINQEYSLHDDSLSLVNMALPVETKTYCDVACGDQRLFEDKFVQTDMEYKEIKDQSMNISPEADDKSTSIYLSMIDNWTQSDTLSINTMEMSSNTTFREVVNSSVQCEEMQKQLDLSFREFADKSIQAENIDEPLKEVLNKSIQYEYSKNTTEQSSNTSVIEFIDRSIQFDSGIEQSELVVEMVNKSMQCESSIECNSSIDTSTLLIENQSSEQTETTEVNSYSIGVQTEEYESNEFQKQIKEKDALISLKEEIIANLQNKLKTKDEEIEKMSASSVASSQQSMISSYGEPFRPKKPRITLSDSVDQVYLQTMSAREKERKTIESVKKSVDTEKKSLENIIKTESVKKSLDSVKKTDTTKKTVKAANKPTERPKRTTRKKSEPEPELVKEVTEDDIGALFSDEQSTTSTRNRKRERIDKCEEESTTKRMKMPLKEKRHTDSISPVTEVDDGNQKGERRAYNFRSRKQLYK